MIVMLENGFPSDLRVAYTGPAPKAVASHGYLLAQFLNPRVNHRTDRYGGNLEGRLRFIREVLAAVRMGAGKDMLVGIRLSGDETEHHGLEPQEVLEIAAALDADRKLGSVAVNTTDSAVFMATLPRRTGVLDL